ncbi:hypothetical protein ASF43_14100 [Pseudorhodoferax sp. Leaf267]|nr:hypothetical protein ASF43_14100 [Pseudorhodoferax sp. Leaf267]
MEPSTAPPSAGSRWNELISALSATLRATRKARAPRQPPGASALASYKARSAPISRSASWP